MGVSFGGVCATENCEFLGCFLEWFAFIERNLLVELEPGHGFSWNWQHLSSLGSLFCGLLSLVQKDRFAQR